MPRLTEANYASRKIKLHEHIAAAEFAHADALMRRELETGTDSEVTAAKGALDILQSRSTGLDLAWKRTQDENAAAREAEAEAVRLASAKVQHAQLAGRTKAAKAIAKAADALGAAYSDYAKAGVTILDATLGHHAHYPDRGVALLRDEVQGSFTDLRRTIALELRQHGLDMSNINIGIGIPDAAWQRDIVAHVDHVNSRIEPRLLSLEAPE